LHFIEVRGEKFAGRDSLEVIVKPRQDYSIETSLGEETEKAPFNDAINVGTGKSWEAPLTVLRDH
jgi:hypothetical protein